MSTLEERAFRRCLGSCPWQVELLPSVDSTNKELKRRGPETLPEGTVLLTGEQTMGRGRLGRSFSSPRGGIYLSVLLRPRAHLMRLTAAAGAAVRRAICRVTGLDVGIKWRNDLILGGKKVCGILAELVFDSAGQACAILGIGINCNTRPEDLPPEIRGIASSLSREGGRAVDENALAAALVRELLEMSRALPLGCEAWMREYREASVTLGRPVVLLRGGEERRAFAEDMNGDGGLVVRYENGERALIDTGEVSVRSPEGYV